MLALLLTACGQDLGDTGPDDTGAPCEAPPDGVLAAGDWAGTSQGGGLSIDASGSAFAYACTFTADVDPAEITDGAVVWSVQWGMTNDTGEDTTTDGSIAGTFCGDRALLTYAPLWTDPVEFHLGGEMPDICD